MKIERLDNLLNWLRARAAKIRREKASVVVGYQTNYALYVHENLTNFHPIGQAKYLEQPARTMKGELGQIIREGFKQGLSLTQCLMLAGLRLQRESQKLVPVDTGALKNSAFTRAEK